MYHNPYGYPTSMHQHQYVDHSTNFIHNVTLTATGEELVTLVAPVLKGGNWVSERIKDIPASQL